MKTLSLFLSLTALSAPAAAQNVLGLGWAGDVYDIDLATGSSSYVGNCGFSRINAMAKAPDGTLYAMSDSDLEVDLRRRRFGPDHGFDLRGPVAVGRLS